MEDSTSSYQGKKRTKDFIQDSDIRALTVQLRSFTAEQRRTNDRHDRVQSNLFERMVDVEKISAILAEEKFPLRVRELEKGNSRVKGILTGTGIISAGGVIIALILKWGMSP